MKKNDLLKLAAAALMGLTMMSGSAMAQTADGVTPANEGVCNALQGGTPGLYGLCVAYCEAQDLDLVGDKETPNNKILGNYRKKMREGDPDMPCIQVPCPCWNAEQLGKCRRNGDTNLQRHHQQRCGRSGTTRNNFSERCRRCQPPLPLHGHHDRRLSAFHHHRRRSPKLLQPDRQ